MTFCVHKFVSSPKDSASYNAWMDLLMLSCSRNKLGLLWSTFHFVMNTNLMCHVVEHVLTKIHHQCISISRIVAKVVQFGLQQKQLGRTSVLEFFGHVNVGIRPRVEYQRRRSWNFALADQKWEFLLIRAESYEFSSNSAVLSRFHQIDATSVRLHILLVDDANKLVNM
jgi:hypothetical protein